MATGLRAASSIVAAFLFLGSSALAQNQPWQVSDEQKSQKLSPITTGKVTIVVTGSNPVVVRIGSSDTTLKPGDGEVTFDVPSGSDVHVVQDGAPTSGSWRDGS